MRPELDNEKLNSRMRGVLNRTRKIILAGTGIMIALLCGAILHKSIYGVPVDVLSVDKITLPEDVYMKQTDATTLTPIGKMKGEIDGEFQAFYLAIDKEGQVYLNHNPEYSDERYNKSKGWEPVTREQLKVYEKELHFIRHQKKSLKP